MLFESDNTLEPGSRRTKGLALSVGIHLLLFLLALISPDFLTTAVRRVIHVSGHDFEREPFELTELVLPPELVQPQPAPQSEPPVVAGVEPFLPLPAPEAAPPPPPPPEEPAPPPPEPEPEDELVPPPPIIGPDDLIEEGASPDAPLNPPEGAEEQPRIALDEPTGTPAQDGPEGDDGDGGDGPDDAEPQPEAEEVEALVVPEEEPEFRLGENTNPDGLLLPDLRRRANVIIEENAAEARRELSTGRSFGNGGSGDVVPDFSTTEPSILSDTRGFDFGPYMNQIVNRVRVNWYSLIPQAARMRQMRGRVVITFTIQQDGRVVNEKIEAGSGREPLDRAAMGAIRTSNPFPPIPEDFDGDSLVLQFSFLYNMS